MRYKIKNLNLKGFGYGFKPDTWYKGTPREHAGVHWVDLESNKNNNYIIPFHVDDLISEKDEHDENFNKRIDELLK